MRLLRWKIKEERSNIPIENHFTSHLDRFRRLRSLTGV